WRMRNWSRALERSRRLWTWCGRCTGRPDPALLHLQERAGCRNAGNGCEGVHIPPELLLVRMAIRVDIAVALEIHYLPLAIFDEGKVDDAFEHTLSGEGQGDRQFAVAARRDGGPAQD